MTTGRLFDVQPDMHITEYAFFGGKPFTQPVSADLIDGVTDLFRTSISSVLLCTDYFIFYHITSLLSTPNHINILNSARGFCSLFTTPKN